MRDHVASDKAVIFGAVTICTVLSCFYVKPYGAVDEPYWIRSVLYTTPLAGGMIGGMLFLLVPILVLWFISDSSVMNLSYQPYVLIRIGSGIRWRKRCVIRSGYVALLCFVNQYSIKLIFCSIVESPSIEMIKCLFLYESAVAMNLHTMMILHHILSEVLQSRIYSLWLIIAPILPTLMVSDLTKYIPWLWPSMLIYEHYLRFEHSALLYGVGIVFIWGFINLIYLLTNRHGQFCCFAKGKEK